MKKRLAAVLMTAVLATGIMTGCGGQIEDSDVVATVGKTEIKGDVANFYARYQQAVYETYYGSMMGGADAMWTTEAEKGKTYEETTKESIMTALENVYLIKDHAKDYKVELTEEEEKAISDAADKFVKANKEDVRNVISGDKDTVKEVMELLTYQSKMRPEMVKDIDKNVSDEEAAQKKMQYIVFSFGTDEEAKASEDVNTKKEAKKKAEDFVKAVKGGKDFSAAAQEQGGTASDMTFDSSSEIPAKELVKAADKLKVNEMTDIIETDTGFYIAKLTSEFDKEATDSKKQEIISEREQKQYDKLLKKWRKDAKIEENKKEWKKINFDEQGVAAKTPEAEEGTADTGNTAE
nr:peptidyl-prolyl cis-trans isomerase [uncultured Sellimonas sp.]